MIDGSTMPVSCCHVDAPARRAVSRYEGGSELSAAPNSNIEKAVPRHVLATTIDSSSWSISQRGLNGSRQVERAVLVEERPPQTGDDGAGMIQAKTMSSSRARRTQLCQLRNIQASVKPSIGLADDRRADDVPQRRAAATARTARRRARRGSSPARRTRDGSPWTPVSVRLVSPRYSVQIAGTTRKMAMTIAAGRATTNAHAPRTGRRRSSAPAATVAALGRRWRLSFTAPGRCVSPRPLVIIMSTQTSRQAPVVATRRTGTASAPATASAPTISSSAAW